MGSRDRRFYREEVYTALRYLPWIEPLLQTDPAGAAKRVAWLSADTPATRSFRAELTGDLPPCPPLATSRALILGTSVDELLPGWFRLECPGAFAPPLVDVLQTRSPLWIRIQAAGCCPRCLRNSTGWDGPGVAVPASRARFPPTRRRRNQDRRVPIGKNRSPGRRVPSGVLASLGVQPGGVWLDACAGAGGKALQLAALLGPTGRVVARDPRSEALRELSLRAVRAGLGGRICEGDPDPSGGFDGVLVDAPCSGSGTWRRSPHLKWTTNEETVRRAAVLQGDILRENAARVRSDGLLVYSTCSLCRTENERVADEFLRAEPAFLPVAPGLTLAPQADEGDGYFVAVFQRKKRTA